MKTVKKAIALILCAVLVLTSFAGCSRMPADALSVWLIVKSTRTAFFQAAFAGANAAKAEYNVDLTIVSPETEEDYEAENRFIAQAVEEGADAIVLSAISYTENVDAVDAAVEAGVKVVVIDSDVESEGVSARIGTDNEEAGRMACRSALSVDWQELNVGIINFDAGVRNGQEREAGFREMLYKDPRVRQIYTINVPADAEQAREETTKLLRDHPEINILTSFNEPLAVGAARAVEELGLGGKIRLIGFDTNVECIDMMQRDVVSALVVQNPYAMGYLGIETAWKILNGEISEPCTILNTPAVIITKDTMYDMESQKVMFPFG